MKKIISLFGAVLWVSTVLAVSSKNCLVEFSTQGPDFYADGSPVLANETYLLVYVNKGAQFGGVYTTGELVNTKDNKIVCRASAIVGETGSKCGMVPVTYAPADGEWVVVLLDTRTNDGMVGGLVSGQGVIASTVTVNNKESTSSKVPTVGSKGRTVLTSDESLLIIPAGTPIPEIAAIEQIDAKNVNLYIKNFSVNVPYTVETRTSLASSEAWTTKSKGVRANASNVKCGKSGGDELATPLAIDPSDKVRFFRVKINGTSQSSS